MLVALPRSGQHGLFLSKITGGTIRVIRLDCKGKQIAVTAMNYKHSYAPAYINVAIGADNVISDLAKSHYLSGLYIAATGVSDVEKSLYNMAWFDCCPSHYSRKECVAMRVLAIAKFRQLTAK